MTYTERIKRIQFDVNRLANVELQKGDRVAVTEKPFKSIRGKVVQRINDSLAIEADNDGQTYLFHQTELRRI